MVEGRIAYDTDDEALEVYDGANSRLIPTVQTIHRTVWDPDGIQETEDAVPIYYVNPARYPDGITLLSSGGVVNDGIQLFTDQANSASVTFEEWTYGGVHVSDIVTITFASTAYGVPSSALSDASIAAGNRIYVDFDDTDLNWLDISIPYWIKEND